MGQAVEAVLRGIAVTLTGANLAGAYYNDFTAPWLVFIKQITGLSADDS